MPEQENQLFTYYLKKILLDYRRPTKEPRVQPNTDVIFEKIPIKYEQLESYLIMKKKNKVLAILKGIYDDINILCDGQSPKFVWDSTLFVLKLFHDKDNVLLEHNRELERLFGTVDFNTTTKFFKAVKEFKQNFEDDPMFVKLCLNNDELEQEMYYEHKMLPSLYITENEIHGQPKSNADLKRFELIMQKRLKKLKTGQNKDIRATPSTSDDISLNEPFTDCKSWMLKLFTKHGCSKLNQHVDRLINLLTSDENDVSIQDSLVGYIGYENMSLAGILLQNRQNFISINNKKPDKSNESRPALSPQVVVLSKQEKSLAKKFLKLQKKRFNKVETTVNSDRESYEQMKDTYLKAKAAPLLRRAGTNQTSSYPNVYDAQNSNKFAQVNTSQLKTAIPANAIRKDTNVYEEFEIPAHEKKDMIEPDKLIKINSLDRISQVIFNHVKTLNVIQSLVFPIAYATNENMLICAPTGAGKTNTALLTIAHQILQHTTEGVINRNEFKIVYVCPMKALSAEMASNFGKILKPLGLTVREVTGDMQVSNQELKEAHMIVTTPEKWDIITRKGGANGFVEIVKLLIIDEVHLLAGDRGPVIEALVARTLRQVESSQKMIRIIGLSATLPNYQDVAKFLRVTPRGLFYFDSRFRPVPLKQTFIGVKAERPIEMLGAIDNVCFEKVKFFLQQGHQCMVFVHARNQTGRTANFLKMEAQKTGVLHLFESHSHPKMKLYKKRLERSSNPLLSQLINFGLGIHNAGMTRTDRDVMEECFREGIIRCLVTTATLAWGVNLPAHGVIIKGTEIYNAAKGGFTDLDLLDVLQIFGRAGRPQYDTSGTAIIITKHDKLHHYMRTLIQQCAIESKFLECLVDNLNAEIVLGTITNEDEGIEWLRYTYFYQRLMANPYAYGVNLNDVQDDGTAIDVRRIFIQSAAEDLQQLNMIRYNRQNGDFASTTMGRIASIYYLKYGTVRLFSNFKYDAENDETLFDMMAHATEFQQIKTREDEFKELDEIVSNVLNYNIPGHYGNECFKINALMQAYISRARLQDPTLVSEQAYIVQNVLRVSRALFEIGILRNNALMAEKCLNVAKMFEQQVWDYETPLRQFPDISPMICNKIENQKYLDIEKLRDLDVTEIAHLIRDNKDHAALVKRHAEDIPLVDVESTVQPITHTVIRVVLTIKPRFSWNSKFHGPATEHFSLWISDVNEILHSESFVFRKKQVLFNVPVQLVFSLRLPEKPPTHFLARICSERWLGATYSHFISFRELVLPKCQPQPTNLLTLQPLPISALKKEKFEELYTGKFSHFNPIQTQVFFCLYNTDNNVLIGAPTGSGKTIMAEFAILRLLKNNPKQKVVYVAPMKALVRERVQDWIGKFKKINKTVIEITGDVSPTVQALNSASIIITTPEKWDSLSRGWQGRNYVQQIGLMIIDEIHLLGEERGPVLEVIVSRTNYIAAKTGNKIRLVGLSTSMANARDLAEWLGIGKFGMFNFRSSVRPVPIEVHMGSTPGKHYCPRMKAMNKPVFQAIRLYSPEKPSLVFVSSRRQTRLTAQDLITYLGGRENPRQWLHMNEKEMLQIVSIIKDPNLKLFLPFGIGTHHAGLEDNDRKIIEKLFVEQKIQVLIATATLAWGVNFPAHLVVVKGTEYFDGKKRGYTDMPVTDVLQMVGRAGRPQYDDHGVAVVLVHDIKKNFYKRFLYEPFPIESNLLSVFPDHINAEIAAGTCSTKIKIFEYLTWTFFYRRLSQSPTYYNLRNLDLNEVKDYLNGLIDKTLGELIDSGCIEYDQINEKFKSTTAGSIACYYYLSHKTMYLFHDAMAPNLSIKNLLLLMSSVYEYSDFPVRHNEELINEELDEYCRMHPGTNYELPETKVFLLLQAHFSRIPMPIPDYKTDLKLVLGQILRIIQAMIDFASSRKWLTLTLKILSIIQMIIQGAWGDDSPFKVLADIDPQRVEQMEDGWKICMPSEYGLSWVDILHVYINKYEEFQDFLQTFLTNSLCKKIDKALSQLPMLNVKIFLVNQTDNETMPIFANKQFIDRITVKNDVRYYIRVEIAKNRSSTDAYSPRFSRPKEECWNIILGNNDRDRLISIKRLSPFKLTTSCKLEFEVPKEKGYSLTYTLFIMPDCYIGLDQQYSFEVQL